VECKINIIKTLYCQHHQRCALASVVVVTSWRQAPLSRARRLAVWRPMFIGLRSSSTVRNHVRLDPPLLRDQLFMGMRLAFRTLEWSCFLFDRTICPTSWRCLVQIRSEIGCCWVLSQTRLGIMWNMPAMESWECVGHTVGQKHWASSVWPTWKRGLSHSQLSYNIKTSLVYWA